MGEAPDQIRREIEQARSRLGRDLNELEYKVKSDTDQRVQCDRHPWAFVGAAFGGAFLLGWVIGRPGAHTGC
jgi:hypothetical protein